MKVFLTALLLVVMATPALATGYDLDMACQGDETLVRVGDHEIGMAHIRLDGEDNTWHDVELKRNSEVSLETPGAVFVDLWVTLDGTEIDIKETCESTTTTSTTTPLPTTTTTTTLPTTTTTSLVPPATTTTSTPSGTTTTSVVSSTTTIPTTTSTSSTTTTTTSSSTTSTTSPSTTTTSRPTELPSTGPSDALPWIALAGVVLVAFGAKFVYTATGPVGDPGDPGKFIGDDDDDEPYNIISE